MDADAESAADVAPCGVAVHGGEDAHRVEHQQLPRAERRVGRTVRVAQGSAPRFVHQAGDAALVHFVRGDDEFHVGILVHEPNQQLFVGSPGRPGHEKAFVALETLDEVEAFGRRRDLGHAVEAGVARDQHVVESQSRQQLFGLLVLHENRVEGLQRLTPQSAVGAEEDGVAAENRRDDVGADLPSAQFAQQVEPEFVFDEDGDFGTGGVEKPAGMARSVYRKVEDVVRAPVVLADFVARRGEEGDENFEFGVFVPQTFDDGTSLFEFAERGYVYPDRAGRGVDGFGHPPVEISSAFEPEPGFLMPRCDELDGPHVKSQTEIIDPHRFLRCGLVFIQAGRAGLPEALSGAVRSFDSTKVV